VKAAYPAAAGVKEYEGGLVLPHASPPVPPTRSLRRIRA